MFHTFKNSKNRFQPKKNTPKPLPTSLFINKANMEKMQSQEITHQFSDFLISEQLKRNISDKGYSIPTPIQDKVIPEVLQGRDVIGIANTGTGKTGAFLIPLINKVLFNRSERVLIISPTRELALQIQEECEIFSKGMNIGSVLIIGGVGIGHQLSSLKRHPNFVIATPGRLKDLIMQGHIRMMEFNNTVLDEVDRMMDMGFINDMKFIISKLPFKRQSLFFSATIPPQIMPLIQTFLKNPVTISVKLDDTSSVEQNIINVSSRNKIDVLHDLLAKDEFKKVIVFGRTKWGMEKVSRNLIKRGFKVAAIHGNKSQGQRQRALDQFKKGEIQALLATDVASRGLDIDDVTHVINYDQPASMDDYTHRIGRTGRANKRGIALTFVE